VWGTTFVLPPLNKHYEGYHRSSCQRFLAIQEANTVTS